MAEVKIYQINSDNKSKMFLSYDSMKRAFGEIDMSWYDEVYSFDEDITDDTDYNKVLEDIFYRYRFNCEIPDGFKGHSLSASDVIVAKGRYFFCDRIGWREF